jgi:LDH2 family malate/lactate/ureidoglycolate dehydrogenase
MNQEPRLVPVDALSALCEAALHRCGLCPEDVRTTVDVLVGTDMMGIYTHGTRSLRGYVKRLLAGGLKADAVPEISAEGPAWARINGHSAIAMVTSVFAMKTAVRKAKAAGIAYVGVFNSCHFGAAGQYALLAAREGAIGIVMANDTPSMAVPGSRAGVLGTNPFAYAVPALQEDPILLDIASSAVAGGKVRVVQLLHLPAPEGWLVDAEGLPTTDPFVYPHHGALLPFAGHKGYGIALLIETLAAMVTGAGVRWDVGSWMDSEPSQPTHHGAAFLAIDVAVWEQPDAFKLRVDALIRAIRAEPKAKGSERIYVPGELEWAARREALARGIPLPDDVRASLRELSADLGLSADWLAEESTRSRS